MWGGKPQPCNGLFICFTANKDAHLLFVHTTSHPSSFTSVSSITNKVFSSYKGTVQIFNYSIYINIFFLLPVVLFISLDSFGVSCLVLEISAIEISAFYLI